jgi:hypothetical protein
MARDHSGSQGVGSKVNYYRELSRVTVDRDDTDTRTPLVGLNGTVHLFTQGGLPAQQNVPTGPSLYMATQLTSPPSMSGKQLSNTQSPMKQNRRGPQRRLRVDSPLGERNKSVPWTLG